MCGAAAALLLYFAAVRRSSGSLKLAKNIFDLRGAKGTRTPGLLHAMQALYQLSYSPWMGDAEALLAPAHVSVSDTGRSDGTGEGAAQRIPPTRRPRWPETTRCRQRTNAGEPTAGDPPQHNPQPEDPRQKPTAITGGRRTRRDRTAARNQPSLSGRRPVLAQAAFPRCAREHATGFGRFRARTMHSWPTVRTSPTASPGSPAAAPCRVAAPRHG